ncbi:phage tail protein [Bifidobacterium pseudolongum]|uniref:Tail protein n=1 Tax=Bifidobacterium pseudolongum subsp. globosum TaxID=1690 RepID=A0A4Q5A3C7_9BIFI|nr:tape measure protein [Bifidobacterium pseudolongum]RYQ16989.1 tail protein [Bifidobacterium pseudolongum subsp. globosum]
MAHSVIMSVRITGNATDAQKAFSKTATKAAALGTVLGNLATKGVAKVWDTVKGFTKDVFDMSDATDKFKSTMKFAGLDTSAIDRATKATRKYADVTVYELGDIQNTCAQLAANGIKDYVGLTEAAGNLNAVAGGNAETFKSVAMVMTQTAGAGKLTTENWNQLSDAIPGASGKLQEALLKNGAYTGDFREAMAKGMITADEFNKAIMQLGMSDAAKEAAASTATMEGAFGNLEAAIVGGLTDAFDLIKPTVTNAIGAAGDLITDFSKQAVAGLQAAGKWIMETAEQISKTGAFDRARQVWDTVCDTGQRLWQTAQTIADKIGALFSNMSGGASVGETLGNAFNGALGVIDAVAGALGKIADWATNHAELIIGALVGIGAGMGAFKAYTLINSFVQAMKGVQLATKAAELAQAAYNVVLNANPIGIVITALAALVAGLTYFFTQTETGRAAWAAFTQFLTDAWNNVCAVFQIVCDAIGSAWQAICDWVQTAWQAVVDWFTPILETLKGIFEVVCSVIQGYWDVAGEYVRAIWYTVKDAIQTVVNIIKGIFDVVCAVIRGDWQAAGDAIKGIWENIKGFFERTLERIKTMFSNICSAIQSAWQGAGDGVRRIWEGIKAFFGNLCNGVRGFFNGLGNGIRTIFTNAGNGVKSAWNGVLSWFRNLPQSIMNIFSNAGQWLWNAGSNIINGLWNGLKSAWNNVTGWVSGLGDWIASHKGPESYDRQLLVTNGRLIMQGFAKGLTSGFDKDVQRAISGVNGKLKTMPLSVTAAYEMGAGKDTRPNVTVNINGKLLDEESTAAELRRILDDYEARRR